MRSPRERQRQKERRMAMLAAAGGVLVVVAVAAVVIHGTRTRVDRDAVTQCPTNRPLSAYTAVLIDATDELNPVQSKFVMDAVTAVVDTLPENGRLDLFVLEGARGDHGPPFRRKVCRCNPGRSDSDADIGLTDNPALQRKRWQEDYLEPVRAALDSALTRAPSDRTPLLGAIQAVALASPIGAQNPEPVEGRRRLLIVSDMLEHTDDYSHYRTARASLAALRALPAYPRLRTDLRGTEVEILYVRRDDPGARRIQGRAHVGFWEDYFDANHGLLRRVVQVQG